MKALSSVMAGSCLLFAGLALSPRPSAARARAHHRGPARARAASASKNGLPPGLNLKWVERGDGHRARPGDGALFTVEILDSERADLSGFQEGLNGFALPRGGAFDLKKNRDACVVAAILSMRTGDTARISCGRRKSPPVFEVKLVRIRRPFAPAKRQQQEAPREEDSQ